MKELKCDLHIVGGALTGLLTAYCISSLGYNVVISEKKIIASSKKAIYDKRTTAIAEGSKNFLQSQGLWRKINVFAEPIHNIKVIDQTTNSQLRFSNPKPKSNLGYIVKNSKLTDLLINELRKKKNVNFLMGSSISSITHSGSKVISLTNNEKISSQMLIAADGKNSAVRKILGTNQFKKNYKEKALVINFFHEKCHKNIAYEFFLKTGPFAILPMQKENKKNQSALIWSNTKNIVNMISSKNFNDRFVKEVLNEKIEKYLGKVIKINSVQAFPLSAHINEKFYHDKIVYIGDAAHSIHPLAGQGWNLGLRDIKSLIKILKTYKEQDLKIGTKRFCKIYNDSCFYDAFRFFQITDKLDWIFKKDQTHVKFTKKMGFDIINRNNTLNKKIVEFAMGI